MKFTVALPLGDITPGEFQTPEAVREIVTAMEVAGIDAGYLTDHPAPSATWLHAHGHDALDSLAAFGFVAAVSSRLKLHTSIVVAAYRNPFILAKSAATVQALSGGRLILGMGAGYQKEEFDALGVDFHRRGKLFDEALEVIRLAWAGGVVTYRGMGFEASGNEPRPVPDPSPTIWVGGGSDAAVERAARWGDGWSPFFSAPTMSKSNQASAVISIDHLAEKIDRIRSKRSQLGRNTPFDFVIGPRAKLDVAAKEGAEALIEDLYELAAVGVTWASIELPSRSRQQFLEAVQWFGEEVITQAR